VADPQAGETNEEFEAVLRHSKQSRGFDFTGYKRTSLMRRVQRRMSQVGIDKRRGR
jgi:two-component system CheB/CheR fusion protein